LPPCSKLSPLTRMMPADGPWRIGGRANYPTSWICNSTKFVNKDNKRKAQLFLKWR
jgi:hypothetical protein